MLSDMIILPHDPADSNSLYFFLAEYYKFPTQKQHRGSDDLCLHLALHIICPGKASTLERPCKISKNSHHLDKTEQCIPLFSES